MEVQHACYRENNCSKSSCFVEIARLFLRLGLEWSGGEESSTAQLSSLAEKLDKILYFVSLDGEELGDECSVDEKEKAKQAIREVSAQFPAIKKAYLFGSFARGTFTDNSDIDIRVKLDRSIPFNLRDLAQYSKRIERVCGREVDVVSSKKIKNKQLEAAINQDKELVYERKEQ